MHLFMDMRIRKKVAIILFVVLTMQSAFWGLTKTVSASAASSSYGKVMKEVYTDKARYMPNDAINVSVDLVNSTNEPITNGTIQLQVYHNNEAILSIASGSAITTQYNLEPWESRTEHLTWSAPAEDYQGYLLEVCAYDGAGKLVDVETVGVDVSSSWVKFPRYGYLYDFGENVQTSEKIQWMNKYHINAIEYYDWHYLHHQPLASGITRENPGVWQDWAGRNIYGKTIQDYIAAAKDSNMVNMAYNMIYAGTDTFFKDADGNPTEANDWKIYFNTDNPRGTGPFYFTMGNSPSGNGHLYFVNPLNSDWQNHIFTEENKIFQVFDFDGWHGDTVGDWGEMMTVSGSALGYKEDGTPIYKVTDTYTQFLNAAKAALGNKYLSFNPVGAQGIQNANISDTDVLYTEFWPWDKDRNGVPYDTYYSLAKEVENSMNDSKGKSFDGKGKSLVVKAYINYAAAEGYMNTPAVILADAAVYAAGGSRLEIGNGDNMLHKEYYPDDKVYMSDTLKERMRNMSDFTVAYENLLRDGQTTTENQVSIDGYASNKNGDSNSIWTYTRQDDKYQVLHLINLLNTDNKWRDEYKEKSIPAKAENLHVKYYYTKDINGVYLASPDNLDCRSESISFKKGSDGNGNYVEFTVPSLEYWDMIYMTEESPDMLLSPAEPEVGNVELKFEAENYYSGNKAEGQADLQPGEDIKITLPETFLNGKYNISVISCGNRTQYDIKVDGEKVGSIQRNGTGFGINEMTTDNTKDPILLTGGKTLSIQDNGIEGSGYGWVDKIVLTLIEEYKPEQPEGGASYQYPEYLYLVEGENGKTTALPTQDNHPEIGIYGNASNHALIKNIGLNQGYVELTLPENVVSGNYDLVLNYSSGVDGEVNVWVNDTLYTLPYSCTDAGWGFKQNTIAIKDIALKAGDIIKVQDGKDNCWIWLDYIYLINPNTYTEPEEPEEPQKPEEPVIPELKEVTRLEAENGILTSTGGTPGIYEDSAASSGKLIHDIGLEQGYVTITVPSDLEEKDYYVCLAYSSGTNGSVKLTVNNKDEYVKEYTSTGGWEFKPGNFVNFEKIHLKGGDEIKIHDAANNCYIWLDYVSLNSIRISINDATVDNIPDTQYTGSEIKPSINLVLSGKTLVENQDYKLYYENNINEGMGKVIIKGIGNYTGTKTVEFVIKKNNAKNENSHIQEEPIKTEEPSIVGLDNSSGWKAITQIVSKIENDNTKEDKLVIEMKQGSVIPQSFLSTMKGKNILVEFKLDGYSWLIHGKDITAEKLNDVDLAVQTNTNNIPKTIIQNTIGSNQYEYQQLNLTHNGNFGFKAILSIGIKEKGIKENNDRMIANLFYYDPVNKSLKLQSVGKVDENGYVNLTFHHASDYCLVLGDKVLLNTEKEKINAKPVKNTLYIGGTIGKTTDIKLYLTDAVKEAIEKGIIWKEVSYVSNNKKVALVSSKGKITAVGEGTTTIITTVKLGGEEYSFQNKIKVAKANIKAKDKNVIMHVGEKYSAAVNCYGLKKEDITYKTTRKDRALISSKTGMTIAKTKGIDYIIAEHGKIKEKIKVVIK